FFRRGFTIVVFRAGGKVYSIPTLQLCSAQDVSHDTKRFRFGLPSSTHILGLPVSTDTYLSGSMGACTPVSRDEDQGFVDLVVKVYYKNIHSNYPDRGKMSQSLDAMSIGDKIDFRGPGLLVYIRNGNKFAIKPNKNLKCFSGITSMLQLIHSITADPADATKSSLMFANQTKDILLREELEKVLKSHSEQLNLWFTLDKPPQDWKYSSGFVNADMMKEHLPLASNNVLIVMCGPPPMTQHPWHPNLSTLGYKTENTFTY
uniref:Cytochrome b5 reductase 2 n=1 Tax=Salmo trutta TaxID=8032 RepID=A0A673Y4R9_SALTR